MMLYNLLLGVYIFICLLLIVVVLMQSSKGGGLAGAFGGGGDSQVFGGQETASFLTRATTYLAIGFMVLSLLLALMTSKRNTTRPDSVLRRSAQEQGNVIPTGQSVEDILGTAAFDSIPADTTLQDRN